MKKDYITITIFRSIFIIVLIITVVISVKYASKNREIIDAEAEPTITAQPSATITPNAIEIGMKQTATEYKIEFEQIENNDFVDFYISNPGNIGAIEFTVELPDGANYLNTADVDLFYDVVAKQNAKQLKVGGLSLQVVSPKTKYKFLRIFFDKPLTQQITISSQTFLDQQNNEI